MRSEALTVTCYENTVPAFVEADLERLYGNIFSTLLQYRTYGLDIGRMSTYVVRAGSAVVTLYLFLREAKKVVVLNEGIVVDKADLSRFSNYIFSRYETVELICFKAVQTNVSRLLFPHQRINYLEDLVLALPATVEDYSERLAKHTHRNIRRYLDKLRRDHPSFRFDLNLKMGEQGVRSIIELNRMRMARKKIVSAIDEQETEHIAELVAACGAVGTITVDGRLCAGAISYRVGDNYFLNVLAHDTRFDQYGLGLLCCYLTICECIRRGGREFHFLWGRYDYKLALLAQQRDLDCITIYRSHACLLLNADHAARLAFHGAVRQVKLWLRHEDSLLSQLALRCVSRIREFKHAVPWFTNMRLWMLLRKEHEE